MIAVVNLSKRATDADVEFWAAACDIQARAVAADWGVPYIPVIACSLKNGPLPVSMRVMTVEDSIDVPGALGYHTDVGGVIYGRVLEQGPATSITLSHECMEETVDPTCDQWLPGSVAGTSYAKEVGDPVEADSYLVTATVAGESRSVAVSNYVLPAWFGAAHGPYDAMRLAAAPFQMTPGGYVVVSDASGEHDVFANRRVMGNPGLSRIQNPHSRLLRRLTGRK
jgi:hypothetical protein